jgi:HlyD family secretion protein
VIAPGAIVVDADVKKVQLPTGGVVGEILVKEGDEVKAGQIVLRLDNTVTAPTSAWGDPLDETTVREYWLHAGRGGADALAFGAEMTGPTQRSVGGAGAFGLVNAGRMAETARIRDGRQLARIALDAI